MRTFKPFKNAWEIAMRTFKSFKNATEIAMRTFQLFKNGKISDGYHSTGHSNFESPHADPVLAMFNI